jgi:hypothetical protein
VRRGQHHGGLNRSKLDSILATLDAVQAEAYK